MKDISTLWQNHIGNNKTTSWVFREVSDIWKEQVSKLLSCNTTETLSLEFYSISSDFFYQNKIMISNLISSIWWSEDSKMPLAAMERSFTEEEWSYYYLIKDWENLVGLTGYYEIDSESPIVWLNHHWIIPSYRWKWLWKESLWKLVHLINVNWKKNLSWILELVPTNNQEIENIFKAMWFIDYTQEALQSLEFVKTILVKWYYNKAYLLKIS